jgi:arsenate reductase
MSDDDIIKALVDNPKLMERPIVTTNKQAIIGRPPENVLNLFS